MGFKDWLESEANIDDETDRRGPAEFVTALLRALSEPGDVRDISPEVVDKALWAISLRLDDTLWHRQLPESLVVSALDRLPAILEILESAGYGEITAFTYFWEGFLLSAWKESPPIQAAAVSALREQWAGGRDCRWAVIQGLESMHGTTGAVQLAEELLGRADDEAERSVLTRIVGELRRMDGRSP